MVNEPYSYTGITGSFCNSIHPYDLVLMNNQMPNISGIDATARLRSLGVSIPIIGVTGDALVGHP